MEAGEPRKFLGVALFVADEYAVCLKDKEIIFGNPFEYPDQVGPA